MGAEKGKRILRCLERTLHALLLIFIILLFVFPDLPAGGDEPLRKPEWIGIDEFRGGITLRWFRVQSAIQYVIERKVSEKGEYLELARVNNPVYEDFSLVPEKSYFYRIVPVGREGVRGPVSQEKFFRLSPPVPEQLDPPTWEAYHVMPDGIALAWSHDDFDNVLTFKIYRKGPGQDSFSLLVGSTETNYLDRNVVKDQSYQYVISALDKKLEETENSEVLEVFFRERLGDLAGDPRLAAIKSLEEITSRTELVASYSWQDYGFVSPVDIEYRADEQRLYVSDAGTGFITVIGSRGEVVYRLGGRGESPWQFERLLGIALDASGFLYAVDAYKGEIVVFTPRGSFLRRIILQEEVREYFGTGFRVKYPWFRFGLMDLLPRQDGTLLVVDNPDGWIYVLDSGDQLIDVIGEKGLETGQLHYPTFLASDALGNILVSDTMNSRLQVFNAAGSPQGILGGKGLGIGQFLRPKGIAIDDDGYIYVADSQQNVIQVFNADGQFVSLLGDEKGLPIDIGSPNGIEFTAPDLLFICEKLSRRIQVRKVYLNSKLIQTGRERGR